MRSSSDPCPAGACRRGLARCIGRVHPALCGPGHDRVAARMDAAEKDWYPRSPATLAPPRPRPSRSLHLRGNLDSWTGYGQIAQNVGFGLRDLAGLDLSWGAIKLDEQHFPTHPAIKANLRDAPPPGANVLQVATPSTPPHEGAATAALTMWEADRIDAAAVAQLNRLPLVIVPCEHNRRAFAASGVTAPIRVVPMGLDTAIYRDRGDYPTAGRFRFGCAGRMGHGGMRKNLAFAAECFARAADAMPEAELWVKVWPDCRIRVPEHPRIVLDRSLLDPRALGGWLARLNCYLNPSRGEGWGMIGHQAMAVGRPMVACAASATPDFWRAPDHGWEVAHVAEPAGEFYADGSGARWCSPVADSFIAALRAAYADRDECRRRGAAAAEYAATFPWSRTACGVRAALAEFGFLPKPRVALGTPRPAPGHG